MNHQEIHEAAEILMTEIEAWRGKADGNVMASVAPADDPDADFQVTITYYPTTWRHHPDGEKVAVDFLVSLGDEDWDGESQEAVREQFQVVLGDLGEKYRATQAQRAGESR